MLERHLPDLARIREAAQQAHALLDRLTALAGGETPAEPMPAIPPLSAAPALSVEAGRLLVVDDNDLNRELLRDTLAQLGHEVVEARDGFEALEMLESGCRPCSVELVLLDVMMPGLDGPATLERLKASPATRGLPVIMVSALDRMESVVACIAGGAEDYLIRPYNELLLQARVGACLERKRLHDRETKHLGQIDELLHAIFPPEIVVELKQTNTIRPRRYECVGVLFLDVVGFTSFSDAHRDRPEFVVEALQQQVACYERAAQRHGVQKIKTIGDAFMAVAGLPTPCEEPVMRLLRCGVDLVEAARGSPVGWQVRVGIHVGPVVAGKLGQFQYAYDLWGATVNLASRMESTSRPGKITLSPDAWRQVEAYCEGEARDAAVRGIGPMTVWEFRSFRPESGETVHSCR
jgi:class 3 adenylate cyclase/CheY-like chemotaxis protein